jgi:hypothetical protein
VVTFSFVDPGLLSLASFDTHLFAYSSLFSALPQRLKKKNLQTFVIYPVSDVTHSSEKILPILEGGLLWINALWISAA